jgi:hypothetical protein
MKYGRFVVLIHNDSAEVWVFRHRLTLVIGAQNIMASTGVFVRVNYALRISSFPCSQRMLVTYLTYMKSYSYKKMGPERDFYEGRQRTNQTERQPRKVNS